MRDKPDIFSKFCLLEVEFMVYVWQYQSQLLVTFCGLLVILLSMILILFETFTSHVLKLPIKTNKGHIVPHPSSAIAR